MAILDVSPLPPSPSPWPTVDPFLFCVHHDDAFPAGDERMGPRASLAERHLGSDFSAKDGWSMYHGRVVPGFPSHPHRGFETVSLVRRGLIDHSDSMGATARYGQGDVQWMTAGRGIVHSEMFPLVNADRANPTELFQIWLNLPAAHKMVEPHFTMFWAPEIPRLVSSDDEGRSTEVLAVAGAPGDMRAPSPPPASWASRPEAELAIWTIRLAAHARWTLPTASEGVNRVLYSFTDHPLTVDGQELPGRVAIHLEAHRPITLVAGARSTELLMLQGRPIGEPVAHHGPFVMNTDQEIRQAYADYRSTGFGGWPWDRPDPVHPRDEHRFAIHADGHQERPPRKVVPGD